MKNYCPFAIPLFIGIGSTKLSVQVTTEGSSATAKDFLKTSGHKEFESSFPDGQSAWEKYIDANLEYPEAAAKLHLEGTVVVKFTIEPDGPVRQAQRARGSVVLVNDAIKVVMTSPKWLPATIYRKSVRSYKQQAVTIRDRGD